MAMTPSSENVVIRKLRHQKLQLRRSSLHIDMTPMVDLAFLLLTFFMLTTEFNKKYVMAIEMPPKGKSSQVPESRTITILLTAENRIVWYHGVDNSLQSPNLNPADFSLTGEKSIHRLLLEKNKLVLDKIKAVKDSASRGLIMNDQQTIKTHVSAIKSTDENGLIVLVKPDDKSKYKNLVNMLDELSICNVAHYSIVDLSANERIMMDRAVKQ